MIACLSVCRLKIKKIDGFIISGYYLRNEITKYPSSNEHKYKYTQMWFFQKPLFYFCSWNIILSTNERPKSKKTKLNFARLEDEFVKNSQTNKKNPFSWILLRNKQLSVPELGNIPPN